MLQTQDLCDWNPFVPKAQIAFVYLWNLCFIGGIHLSLKDSQNGVFVVSHTVEIVKWPSMISWGYRRSIFDAFGVYLHLVEQPRGHGWNYLKFQEIESFLDLQVEDPTAFVGEGTSHEWMLIVWHTACFLHIYWFGMDYHKIRSIKPQTESTMRFKSEWPLKIVAGDSDCHGSSWLSVLCMYSHSWIFQIVKLYRLACMPSPP